jgi:uncharacterized repeat protein (TIGR03803 family)
VENSECAKIARTVAVLVAASVVSSAQTFKTLVSFTAPDGANPTALIQGIDGNFYGTTVNNGAVAGGTVFQLTPTGKLKTLYNFCSETNCTDGKFPIAALMRTSNGTLYGTTLYGGTYDGGTVFKISPGGEFSILYSFCSIENCADGGAPNGLVQGVSGNFYGTTYSGGAYTNGTVFEITPAGKLTTLYSFCPSTPCVDGMDPEGTLALGPNGNLYGTTVLGGSSTVCGELGIGGCGTVFEITPSGKLTTLYSFCVQASCSDGNSPYVGLTLGTDGAFFGTTYYGGSHCQSSVVCGTVFRITTDGELTTLHSFCSDSSCTDGSGPLASLVQGSDGNFYGTTSAGGGSPCVGGCGTIFQITTAGELTTLHSFCSLNLCPDGFEPSAPLLQATHGSFYGSTFLGGSSQSAGCIVGGCGTLFNISTGLGPFVEATPDFGMVGQVVGILGNDLTGTTGVTFGGTPAKFKIVSDTFLRAEVPTGATTGKIEVETASGTLSSNVSFYLIP